MNKVSRWTAQLSLAVAFCFGAHSSLSQGIVTGSIDGSVQDPSSAVIQGATVTAVQVGTNSNFKSGTGTAGTFQLPGLPVGKYVVAAEAPGFVALRIENVQVQAGTATPLGALDRKSTRLNSSHLGISYAV